MTWPMYRHAECRYRGRLVKLQRMQCELLAALLLHRGRMVRVDEMIEWLWPDPDLEPEQARNGVAVHLSRLRRLLPGLIVTRGHTFTIDRPGDKPWLDLPAFIAAQGAPHDSYKYVRAA